MKNLLLGAMGAMLISFGVPLALGNAYGFSDVEEDSPKWSCVDNGNHVCGPNNPEGVPPGHYDAGGVLDVPWSQMTIA